MIPPPKQQATLFSKPSKMAGHRVLLYGTGGIGKTTLCSKAPGKVLFLDAEDSLGKLKLDPDCLRASNWGELRNEIKVKRDAIAKTFKTVVLDSGTKLESWATEHTLQYVKKDKDSSARSIEDYGYGKGYRHVFDTFLCLLADLDALCRLGVHVIMICHDRVATVPNPEGEDWIRYEPRLQPSDKASILLSVKEWSDHTLFMGYDVAVKDGVGKGQGTKTIYTAERPHFMAKSRTTQEQIPISDDTDVWAQILT